MLLRFFSVVLFFGSIQLSLAQIGSNHKTQPGKIFVKVKANSNEKITYSLPDKNQSNQRSYNLNPNANPVIHPSIKKIIDRYSIDHIDAAFHASVKMDERLKKIYIVHFSNDSDKDSIIKSFQRLPFVEYAEAVPLYEIFYAPNDIKSQQWYLPKINAASAWDVKKGSGKVIAIVDDAVRLTHEDLAANIWINPGEIAGNNIDDDGNGYVDDVHGYDVADNDNNPATPVTATNSEFTHGTHCSGIAAAVTDNGKGISSISYGNKIMAVKCKSSLDLGPSLPYAYEGLMYAIEAGADVISMSWGGYYYSATYQLLFDVAYDAGIVCVAAAGNSNTSIAMYPAGYNHVISVAATDQNDVKAYFSNYGSTIDVSAPGVDIYSTLAGSDNAYGYLSGTSMACPLVSGLCALMLSYNPDLTPDEVEQCLKSKTDFIDNINTAYAGKLGTGRINSYNTLLCLQKTPTALFESEKQLVCPGQAVLYKDLSILNTSTGVSWEWTFPGGSPSSSVSQNPSISYAVAGIYSATLKVTNAFGNSIETKTNYITVNTLTATLSGGASIPSGGSAVLKVDFSNVAGPYSISYTDGSTVVTKNNITDNPYYLTVNPNTSATYTLTSASSAVCTGTYSGSALVVLDPLASNNCSGTTSYMFERTYGSSVNETGSSILQIGSDYYMTGTAGTAPNTDFYVSKLNSSWDVQWTKKHGTSAAEIVYQSVKTTDGGIISCGTTSKNGSLDAYVVKTDLNGNLLWSKTYGGSKDDYAFNIQNTSDGGYALCGRTDSYTSGIDAHVIKIDATGNIQWSKYFGRQGNDYIFNFYETQDGGYITAGSSQQSAYTNYDWMITKLSAAGAVVWTKIMSSADDEGCRRLLLTADGGFLCVGHSRYRNSFSDAIIVKLDANGNRLWSRSFGGSGSEDMYAISKTADGNYIAAGYTDSFGSGGFDIFLTKFDENGNVFWDKIFGGTSAEIIASGEIVNSSDGGYLLVGTTASFGSGGTDAYLLKTDCNGNSDCTGKNVTFEKYALTPLFVSATVTITDAPGSGNPVTTTTASTVQNLRVCNKSCTINADFYANDTTVCKGTLINFTSTSTNATTYKWFVNNVLIGQNTTASYAFAQKGDYTVLLEVSNANCSDIHTLIISVKGDPLLIVSNDTTICNTTSAKLLVSGAKTYTWSNAATLNCSTCANPVATPPASTYYKVIGTDVNGCKSKDSVYVKVRCCVAGVPSPAATFIISDSIICKNESISFNASYVYNNTLQVLWDFGPAATPQFSTNRNEPNVRYSQAGRWPVKLTLTDICGKDSLMTHINVFDPPVVQPYSDVFICSAKDSVQFTNTPISDYEYVWVPSRGLSNAAIPNPLVKLIDESINYTLYIKDSKTGCESVDHIKVSSHTSFKVQAMNDTFIKRGDEIVLTACCGKAYNWSPLTYLSGSDASRPVVKPESSTLYYVEALDSIGCKSIDSVLVNVQEFEPNIPNLITPNNDHMNDTFFIENLCAHSKIEIYNQWGDLVYKSEDYKQDWNASKDSDGMYYVTLIDGCSGKKYKNWLQVMSTR